MLVKALNECEPSHYIFVIVPMILVVGITSIVILMHNFIYFSLYIYGKVFEKEQSHNENNMCQLTVLRAEV